MKADADADGLATNNARTAQIDTVFRREQINGQRVAAKARLLGLAVVSTYVITIIPLKELPGYLLVVLALAASSALQLWFDRRPDAWRGWPYLLITLDILLIAGALIARNPFAEHAVPLAIYLRGNNEAFLFIILVFSCLGFSPRLVLFTGFMTALIWGSVIFFVASLPGSIPSWTFEDLDRFTDLDEATIYLQPGFLDVTAGVVLILVAAVMGIVLAAVVERSRRLVIRQADAERARANLSRYFAPDVVEALAETDLPLTAPRPAAATVMFADLVGFTRLAERLGPERSIALLRRFHRRMDDAVFAHDGTLDKYLGDGLMATFGTPRATGRDATNALAAARAMLRAIDAWNGKRAEKGAPPIRLSIGLHHGTVVRGDVGGAQRLEFAVIGDPVNVASRLEALTRNHETRLIVSQAWLDAAQAENVLPGPPADLEDIGIVEVRGRNRPIRLWRLVEPST